MPHWLKALCSEQQNVGEAAVNLPPLESVSVLNSREFVGYLLHYLTVYKSSEQPPECQALRLGMRARPQPCAPRSNQIPESAMDLTFRDPVVLPIKNFNQRGNWRCTGTPGSSAPMPELLSVQSTGESALERNRFGKSPCILFWTR